MKNSSIDLEWNGLRVIGSNALDFVLYALDRHSLDMKL